MERIEDVVDLGVATEETKGNGGLGQDEAFQRKIVGLSDD